MGGRPSGKAVAWVVPEAAGRIGVTDAGPSGWDQRLEVARRLRRRHHRGRGAAQNDQKPNRPPRNGQVLRYVHHADHSKGPTTERLICRWPKTD